MKKYFLLLILPFSLTLYSQNDECTSDASWQETVDWLESNLTTDNISDKDLREIKIEYYYFKWRETFSGVFVEKVLDLKNLNKISNTMNGHITLDKIKVDKFFTNNYWKHQKENPYEVDDGLFILIVNSDLKSRVEKAFNHLIHLNRKRNAKIKKKEKF